MSLEHFKAMLGEMNDKDLLELHEIMQTMGAKVSKIKQQVKEAERELSRNYPICACGEPIEKYGWFSMYVTMCKPAVVMHRKGSEQKAKGVIALDQDSESECSDYALAALKSLRPGWGERTSVGTCGKCGEWVQVVEGETLQWMDHDEYQATNGLQITPMSYLNSQLSEEEK
jgi:hypothetical protein